MTDYEDLDTEDYEEDVCRGCCFCGTCDCLTGCADE